MPFLPEEIQLALIERGEITGIKSISGGSINRAFEISTANTSYFLKYNSAKRYPKMFSSEYKGLQLLLASNSIKIPKPLLFMEGENYSFLLLELIKSKCPSIHFWQIFAEKLAELHRHSATTFGLNFDNYMGSLPQSNARHQHFAPFFIEERLQPQIKMAYDRNLLKDIHIQMSERLYTRLAAILPEEKPALIHGDLWSGNLMSDEYGAPVVFDPACHYGHREADIAMTQMFGGVASEFYHHYQECFPMEKGWQGRMKYYRLYPVLIHLNLFGSSYLHDFISVIEKF
jgi:fructosamine-3-kinase